MTTNRSHLSFARTLSRIFTTLAFAAGVFIIAGCAEKSGTGQDVALPTVYVNCTTAGCTSNSSPIIAISITSSSCVDRTFGEVAAKTTRSIVCTAGGCQGSAPSDPWYLKTTGQPTTTIPSGTYTICACLNYFNGTVPWTSCDQTAEIDNVYIDGTNGTQTLSSWH